MTENEIKQAQKEGKVVEVGVVTSAVQMPAGQVEAPQPEVATNIDNYLVLLESMLKPRRHITAAPTIIPRNFADQFQFYDDGVNRRIYLYINGTWRYAALT